MPIGLRFIAHPSGDGHGATPDHAPHSTAHRAQDTCSRLHQAVRPVPGRAEAARVARRSVAARECACARGDPAACAKLSISLHLHFVFDPAQKTSRTVETSDRRSFGRRRTGHDQRAPTRGASTESSELRGRYASSTWNGCTQRPVQAATKKHRAAQAHG